MGHKLGGGERLGHIVVRSVVEPGDSVGDGAFRREHEDGGGHAGVADGAHGLEAVHAGKHHVADDRVIGSDDCPVAPRCAVVHRIDEIAVFLKDALECPRKPDVVFHDEYPHGRPSFNLPLQRFASLSTIVVRKLKNA